MQSNQNNQQKEDQNKNENPPRDQAGQQKQFVFPPTVQSSQTRILTESSQGSSTEEEDLSFGEQTKRNLLRSKTMEGIVGELQEQLKSEREKNQREAINTEHRFHLLEKQLIEATHQAEDLGKKSYELKQKLGRLEDIESKYETEKRRWEETNSQQTTELKKLQTMTQQLRNEKLEVLQLVEKLQQEKDQFLKQDRELLEQQVLEQQKTISQLKSQLFEREDNDLNTSLEQIQTKRDNEALQRQRDWLDKELNERNEEVLKVRKEKGVEIFGLQQQLQQAQEQVQNQDVELKKLRLSLKEQLSKATEQTRTEKEELESQLEHFKNEAEKNKIYIQIAQTNEKLFEDAKEMVKVAEEQNKQLRQELQNSRKQILTLEEKKEELETKLKYINSSGIQAAPPAVEPQKESYLFTPSSLKEKKLYELENKCQDAERELQTAKQENRILSEVLTNLAKQVEDHAPQIELFKQENRSLKDIQKKYNHILHDRNTWKENCQQMMTEKGVLQEEVNILSTQIQILLKESVNRSAQEQYDTQGQIDPENLFSFKDLGDLQKKNAALIMKNKELSDSVEKLKTKMSEAERELRNLVETREQSEKKMKQFERLQRVFSMNVNSHALATIPNEQITQDIRELQQEFENYKNEMAKTEKYLNDELERARKEVSEARKAEGHANGIIETLNEKFNTVSQNAEYQKNLLDKVLQEKQRLANNIISYEQQINTLNEKVENAEKQTRRLEQHQKETALEKEYLKRSEENYSQELTNCRKQLREQEQLVLNLQTTLNNKRSTYESSERSLNFQIEKLGKEVKSLEATLETSKTQWGQREQDLKLQVSQLNLLVEEKEKERQNQREEVLRLTPILQTLQEQHKQLSETLQKKEEQISMVLNPSTRQGALLQQTREQELQVLDLQEKLDQAQKHLNEYKSLAQLNEETSQQLEDTLQKVRTDLQEKLDKALKENHRLSENFTTLKETFQFSHITEENLKKEIQDLKKQLHESQQKVEEMQTSVEQAKNRVNVAKEEEVQNTKLLREAQMRYEQEFMLHASDIKALSSAREELRTARQQISQIEERTEQYGKQVQQGQSIWETERGVLKKRIGELEEMLQSSSVENQRLHNQFSELNKQIKAMSSESGSLLLTADYLSHENNSVSELRELVTMLKKDKQLVQNKVELLSQENGMLHSQVDKGQKSINELRQKLRLEQERNINRSVEESEHNKLLEQINQLNLLRESNITLRDDAQRNADKVKELSQKLEQLEKSLSPVLEEKKKLIVDKDLLAKEVETVKKENTHWRTRVQKLLEKYQQIDPEEVVKLEATNKQQERQLEELKKRLANIEHDSQAALNLAQKYKNELAQARERITKLQQDAAAAPPPPKDTSRDAPVLEEKLKKAIALAREKSRQLEGANSEISSLKQSLEVLNSENSTLKSSNEELAKRTASDTTDVSALKKHKQEAPTAPAVFSAPATPMGSANTNSATPMGSANTNSSGAGPTAAAQTTPAKPVIKPITFTSAKPAVTKSTPLEIRPPPDSAPKQTPMEIVQPAQPEAKPTATEVKPTATAEAKPATTEVKSPTSEAKPTATEVKPTATEVKPTATEVKPTATEVKPTATEVKPTATEVKPTATAEAKPATTEVKSPTSEAKPTTTEPKPTAPNTKPTTTAANINKPTTTEAQQPAAPTTNLKPAPTANAPAATTDKKPTLTEAKPTTTIQQTLNEAKSTTNSNNNNNNNSTGESNKTELTKATSQSEAENPWKNNKTSCARVRLYTRREPSKRRADESSTSQKKFAADEKR